MIILRQSLCLFSIWIIVIGILKSDNAMIGQEIRLLDRVDNAQTIQGLIMHVDNILNNYLSQQTTVKLGKARAIIWNKSPNDEQLEKYFKKNFQIIEYDETYKDFTDKDFDYTRQSETLKNGIWEKFIYVRVNNERITIFLSYQMDSNTAIAKSSLIDEFLTHALTRMFNKIFNPHKSVYNHGMKLITDGNSIQYVFIYHDNHEGFIETYISTFEDGLKEQAKFDQRKLSSCILKIEKGEKKLVSIRHPIKPGYIVPNFHKHYSIPEKTEYI